MFLLCTFIFCVLLFSLPILKIHFSPTFYFCTVLLLPLSSNSCVLPFFPFISSYHRFLHIHFYVLLSFLVLALSSSPPSPFFPSLFFALLPSPLLSLLVLPPSLPLPPFLLSSLALLHQLKKYRRCFSFISCNQAPLPLPVGTLWTRKR